MTTHAFIQYLKYKWTAKNRHGTHSPFVYDLLENVLYSKSDASLPGNHGIPSRYTKLIARFKVHHQYTSVVSVLRNTDFSSIDTKQTIFILGHESAHWQAAMDKILWVSDSNLTLLVPDIHKTAAHTHAWAQLCATPAVLMSIDIYGIGLLLSRHEFKEKQHFILKY